MTREAIEKIRGDELEEHIYVGAQHEVLNEVNKDEVIERDHLLPGQMAP